MQCSTSNIFKPQVAPLWRSETHEISRAWRAKHHCSKSTTLPSKDKDLNFRKPGRSFLSSETPKDFEQILMACQVCQGNFHLTWRLFHINQTGPQMTCLGHYLKPFHVSNGSKCSSNQSCHANCIQVYIQTKNWYRWTNSCLHYTSWSENLPNFSKSHQISDPKNSQQYMSISIPNSVITSLKKGNNNEPPQTKTLLVVMPLQQKHPPAIREKFWRGAKQEHPGPVR